MNPIDRAKARIGRIKADRATELGVAGHQAAITALGKAAGWKRIKTTVGSMEYAVPTTEKSSSNISFNIGGGNVSKIESKVVDRHKPTEDF